MYGLKCSTPIWGQLNPVMQTFNTYSEAMDGLLDLRNLYRVLNQENAHFVISENGQTLQEFKLDSQGLREITNIPLVT